MQNSVPLPRLATPSRKNADPHLCAAQYEIVHGDAFEWMKNRPANSIHGIVTDPPYGLKEFTESEKQKLRAGRGGRVADSAVV
jgi:16S rRNA G966 N2-methylase RsmD